MDLRDYIHPAGYKIESAYITEVCDGFNGDTLHIIDAGANNATFQYTIANPGARNSWGTAVGAYDPRLGIITGIIKIIPPGTGNPVPGWFSIALDRTRPQPNGKPRIHVFVKSNGGGAPDEGSFTGQGN